MKWRELYSTSVSQVLQELVPEPPVATGRVIKQPYFLAIVKFFWGSFVFFVLCLYGQRHYAHNTPDERKRFWDSKDFQYSLKKKNIENKIISYIYVSWLRNI